MRFLPKPQKRPQLREIWVEVVGRTLLPASENLAGHENLQVLEVEVFHRKVMATSKIKIGLDSRR